MRLSQSGQPGHLLLNGIDFTQSDLGYFEVYLNNEQVGGVLEADTVAGTVTKYKLRTEFSTDDSIPRRAFEDSTEKLTGLVEIRFASPIGWKHT